MLIIQCYYACECGTHHYTTVRFRSAHKLAQWLITESSNIEEILDIVEA